jgi:hypothetical protein
VRLPAVEVIHIPQFRFANSHLQIRLQLLPKRRIGGTSTWGEPACIQQENFPQVLGLFRNLGLDGCGYSIGEAAVIGGSNSREIGERGIVSDLLSYKPVSNFIQLGIQKFNSAAFAATSLS